MLKISDTVSVSIHIFTLHHSSLPLNFKQTIARLFASEVKLGNIKRRKPVAVTTQYSHEQPLIARMEFPSPPRIATTKIIHSHTKRNFIQIPQPQEHISVACVTFVLPAGNGKLKGRRLRVKVRSLSKSWTPRRKTHAYRECHLQPLS